MIFVCTPYNHENPAIIEARYDLTVEYIAKRFVEGKFAFSPVVYAHNIVKKHNLPQDWDNWNNFCIEFLKKATEVHVLQQEGWDKSKGIQGELEIAKMLNIPIKYININ